ncbi:hypothetical protein [Acinetobacter populi]|uniref:SH3 domain protein n=1 Tax=Acinetobacter populi TaxID=1582270 RepID=A0A1Z9YUA9_9GAMM|nr:hypothetical protein [Acinetobacter populi]OUY05800.1 hypothetical protein CAP51_16435 [Acinetobacter populi]
MLKHHALLSLLCCMVTSASWAVTEPATTTNAAVKPNPVATTTTPPTSAPLRQGSSGTAPANVSATLVDVQQKHKLELAQQQKRLELLEQANQKALAQNQELQLKNDNLSVQVQVLQSERSAQMFIYGAVTFGIGILAGIVIYSILYTRRRRQW